MLFTIALGGNALLQRGEPLEAELLIKNSLQAAKYIAQLATEHQVLVVHGNGPQVGLLALQSAAYQDVKPYPFDILGAESQGMIGYVLQQGIDNALGEYRVTTLLTQVKVDAKDPAFNNPAKFIGPVYDEKQAQQMLEANPQWVIKPDGKFYRRVVPSPKPQEVIELAAIEALLKMNNVVIAGGGGGVPCIETAEGTLSGVEAVIDKDMTASLLAQSLNADHFIILTDVAGIYQDWGTPKQQLVEKASAEQLANEHFAAGSMQPKINAACQFVKATNRAASIGSLFDLPAIVEQKAGTLIS